MNNQNKDNLEKFFKEGAQNYKIEFNEGDWRKLETLLDGEMPVAFTFWTYLKKYWPIALFVLLIPLAWYSYFQISESKIKNSDGTGENQNAKIDQESNHVATKNNQIDIPDNNAIIGIREIEKSKNLDVDVGKRNAFSLQNENAETSNSDIVVTKEQYFVGQVGIFQVDNFTTDVDNTNYGKDNYIISDSNYGLILNSGLAYLESIPPKSAINGATMPDLIKSKSINNNSQKHTNKISFFIGIGFSPDFSTVGLGNFVTPGFRWNAMAEVGLSKRFLINTGIVWVKNKYEAYGEDYHAPSRYWKNGIAADEAYGECVMLDIPLNLRYNVILKGRHQFFISGGASTYFLLKEDYYFQYEIDDPELPEHWGTDKMSVYPFGIVNLSFGYQYLLGRKGSIQVEPFIKLPTTGIGWGNVNLHTLGVYFMYKYRIGR